MALAPGTTLGHYTVTSLLGEGGMGQVWEATDTQLNRQVALKILPDAFADDPDRLVRFQREAQILASLNHPNIAAIHGIEEANGTRALVLELVEGPTLADRIAQGAIPIKDALPIATQIAEALEAAHEAGVIHRDLKPANVKVKDDGTVKVLDFGLAKALDATPEGDPSQSPTLTAAATQIGVIMGTAAYMSPEQARGKPVDKRADIWAFGVVLLEMLTGRKVFEGEDVSMTLSGVLQREPDWSHLPSTVSPSLLVFLHRCLDKDPKQRVGDIRDVRLALEGAFEAGPHGPAVATESRSRLWGRPALFALGAASVAAAIAGTTVWMMVEPSAPLLVARSRFLLPADQQFTSAFSQVVDVSPDGAQLVYSANQQLFLRTISELEARPIAGTEGGLGFLAGTSTPLFSPDGQFIVYYDGAFRKIGTDGGTAVTLSQGDPPWGMSWSEDWIVFGQAANGVMRVSANGGTPEQLVTVGSDELAAHPQMLPGTEVVLFTLASAQATGQDRWDTARIVAQTLDSDERKTIVEGGSHARYLATGHLVYALGGTLFAVPFDDRRLEVTGGAVPVVEGVRRSSNFGLATGAAFYGVSSTGSLVFVPGGDPASSERRVLMVPREGDTEPLSLPPDAYRSLRISPDDQRIAFHTEDGQEANIWVYDLAGDRAAQRLTFEGWNRFPIWSGDGQRVVFQSDREGDRALYWQPADGAGLAERLTEPEQGAAHVPESWSPVEDRFSYSEMAQGVVSLWTFSMSDAQTTRFGDAQSIAPFNAEFSPDGNWLAYTLRSGTGANVYVEPFPATGAKYQITTENGHHPVWLPDGPGLSYRIGNSVQVAVSVNTTPSFSFGNPVSAVTAGLPPVEAFTSRSYDVTRDGSAFLAVAPDADVSEAQPPGQVGASQEIRIVLNWFEELKRLVPTN